MMPIQFGVDHLINSSPVWKQASIGMVTNEAAGTIDYRPSRKALINAGFQIRKLFSPEHGLDIQGVDGAEMQDGTDKLTGLPVISLYSNKLAPSASDLADLDIILFDVPDAGSRFYTYLWTLSYVMEACSVHQKKLVILDRPNPVSGNMELAEGPVLLPSQASFIGRWEMPIRHSCTLGELARYFNATKKIGCDLEIIPCTNWKREAMQPDWGLRFVPTSPAIQHFESMLLYPGLCLLEATNISEGRGTENSFCMAGAPWINGADLAAALYGLAFDDVAISAVHFTPTDVHAKYYQEKCGGIRIEVQEPKFFQPVFFGMLLLRLIKEMYPANFEWKPYPTLVNPEGTNHLDKLLGIDGSELLFDLALPRFLSKITSLTRAGNWEPGIRDFLLY